MSLMKNQLEEYGILKKSEVNIETYACGMGKCDKSFRTEKGYENHLKTKHPFINIATPNCSRRNVTSDAGTNTTSPPTLSTSTQTVTTGIVTDKTHNSNNYVTAWSMARLGYADTFCEEIKKMMFIQRRFYNNSDSVNAHRKNNIDPPFPYVSRKPFRKQIIAMANNIKQQLIERIRERPFYSLHIGETVDIPTFSRLLVIVRYINKSKQTIEEDVFFSQAINSEWTENQLFTIIDTVIRNNGIGWKNCVGISMDGVRARSDPLKNFVERLSKTYPSIRITYTLQRRGSFVMENIVHELKYLLNDLIRLVNEFKTRDDVQLSVQIEMKYKNLLNHTNDYWLSYGHVLQPMLSVAEHRQVSKGNIIKLAFLVDIIDHFNELNANLQKEDGNIFDLYDIISGMYDKLGTFKEEIQNDNFNSFRNLYDITKNLDHIPDDVYFDIKSSLKMLRTNLMNYLPVPKYKRAEYEWIRKPFDLNECPAVLTKHDEMREWKLFQQEKRKFKRHDLETFWITMYQNYPNIAIRALKFLLTFRNSRFYEMGFAALVDIRTKHVTDSNTEDSYLRIKLSPIKPEV